MAGDTSYMGKLKECLLKQSELMGKVLSFIKNNEEDKGIIDFIDKNGLEINHKHIDLFIRVARPALRLFCDIMRCDIIILSCDEFGECLLLHAKGIHPYKSFEIINIQELIEIMKQRLKKVKKFTEDLSSYQVDKKVTEDIRAREWWWKSPWGKESGSGVGEAKINDVYND